MISVDVCQGKTVTCGLPPQIIGEYVRPAAAAAPAPAAAAAADSSSSGGSALNGSDASDGPILAPFVAGDAGAAALSVAAAAGPGSISVPDTYDTADTADTADAAEMDDAAPAARAAATNGAAAVGAVSPRGVNNGLAAPPGPPRGKKKKSRQPLLWVDVSSPTQDDWNTLANQFGFHPLALEDARKKNQRAKMDAYPGYLFLTLRAWANSNGLTDDLADATTEIDVFVGPNYIVTVHDTDSASVRETRLRLAQHPEQIRRTPAFLLYLLLDAVVDEFFPVMDALDARIDEMEAGIYAPEAVIDLAPAVTLKKRLLILRQAITPLRDIINQLLRTDDATLAPADLRVYWQDVYDHTLRLIEQVDLHRDILGGVLDAMNAQINNRLNQVMKTLTAVSTILMSAALISGVYGMNFDNMPELHTRYGYFGALAGMVLVALGLAAYFRRIRWL